MSDTRRQGKSGTEVHEETRPFARESPERSWWVVSTVTLVLVTLVLTGLAGLGLCARRRKR